MPKVILQYNLPEEREELKDAQNGTRNQIKLDDIWEQIFRPRHKHGYSDEELTKLVNTKTGEKIMDKLEEIYRQIVNEED